MYNVRLQIEGGYLDVKQDVAFPLNFGVADIRDISKKAGAFSKTITLLGTKNNNTLLGHLYDVNIEEGTFNLNTLTNCTVVQNGIPILSDAYVQLLSVNKVQSTDAYEQGVEYSVLVKDQTSTFFTKLDNQELKDIDYSDLNHTLSVANITGSFSNTVADSYKYWLPWTSDNIYPLKELTPAIYAKVYFDRIFAAAGFSYTWSSLSTCNFDKCIIPYNGDVPLYDYSNYLVQASHAADTISIVQSAGTNITFVEALTGWTEILDDESIFAPLSGTYTVPFDVVGGQSIGMSMSITGTIDLNNATGATAYLVDMTGSGITRGYTYRLLFRVYVNGVYSNQYWGSQGTTFNEGSLANGVTNVSTITGTYSYPISNVEAGDLITIRAGILVGTTPGTQTNQIRWKSVNNTTPNVNYVVITPELTYSALRLQANVSSNILANGATVNMNAFVPDKIKQRDFIKSVFTMFNLYCEPDPETPNLLVLQTRDDYYDSGLEKDWSKKLAKDKDQVLNFLPELSAKRLILTYKQDKDEPNVTYYDTTREVYGQAEYIFDNEYVKGIDTKELLFSPTPIGKTVFNAYVPFIGGSAPKNNIRILLDNGVKSCDSYTIEVNSTTSTTGITTYAQLHHFNDAIAPTFDLNFALCDFLYYDGYNATNNGLYNLFWRRTINQINTGKMLVAEFNLDEIDIQQMRLNDKIYIDNSWWLINRIIDYNASNRQLTKVELLSTDDEINFAPFKTRTPKKPNISDYGTVASGINQVITNNNNTIASNADAIIKGRNNIISGGTKSIIEGDYGIVTEDGVYKFVDGVDTNGENFANTDLLFDGDRSHDTGGFNLDITTDNGAYKQGFIYMSPTQAGIGVDGAYFNVQSGSAVMSGGSVGRAYAGQNSFRIERSLELDYIAKTGTYTITANDYLIDCTANTFTVTLPTAVAINGRTYVIKNSGSGVITLEGDGTETIDGALTQTLVQYDSLVVVSNGTNWIISSDSVVSTPAPGGSSVGSTLYLYNNFI